MRLSDIVPNGYVLDETYGASACNCTVSYTPAYGASYPGFIDTVVRDDPNKKNGNPLDDLNPHFTFTSSTTGADANQHNLLRHGDRVSLTFGIVMIDPARFDLKADLDVTPENTTDGTDPVNAKALSSSATVDFDAADAAGEQNQSENNVFHFNANPEDLDVAISDALFILTNDPGTPLNLNVLLSNHGGHDANDYTVYVTLGQAMTAQLPLPPGCTATSNPPPQPVWNQPAFIPASAAVFACNRGTIAPGATETITFSVIKAAGAVDDDLTFRADVVGEVTLFDGTPLTFSGTPTSPNLTPPSLTNTTPNQQLANNYTLDGVRSRVLGFNLVKNAWYCTEDGLSQPSPPSNILSPTGAPNIPTMTGNLNSQIGEDCAYRIESGGWFGFLTPGFTLIEVQNVAVTDDLPPGQGFISFSSGSAYNFSSTTNISAPSISGGTSPLDPTDITWNFNAAGNGIQIKDEFFRVDFKTRLLNDPVDLAYPVPGGYSPNLHGNTSENIARTSFDAVFNSVSGNVTINVNDTAGIPGYPAPAVRTVDLTEVEPNLIVTKQVCNESLHTPGPGCGAFADTVSDGDTNDSYIYKITLTNEVSSPTRSPAFNVISTDTLDSSDLMKVVDFSHDGLDNDGDGMVDEADEATLFASIPDNTIGNGIPAVITVNGIYNTKLRQVDSGQTITFYYRVDPDITIAPLQTLTNTVSMSYDSLKDAFGNQDTPQIPNNGTPVSGRARIYTSIPQNANVTMIPLLAQPKTVVQLSNTPLNLGSPPHNVSVGEEVKYKLVADLPVANLRQFKIRDELPAGVRCIEGQVVNLNAAPYAAAGFSPGGTFSASCTKTGNHDFVEWNFGDQAVTQSQPGNRFSFPVTFIARVENSAITTEGAVLTNGGPTIDNKTACTSTAGGGVGVCYNNDAGTAVALNFAPVSIIVREPKITLTKSFLPVVNSDAGDILTVTVTATNTGTATAYNLRVLDDLVGSDMTFIPGSLSGTDPPDNVDLTTLGANRPIFSWNTANPDYAITTGAGNAKSFTFKVRVDTAAQPLEILNNTLQAQWNSLPDQNTALNSSGKIDVDGTVLGLRNGAIPNAGNSINDYETTAAASTSVLPLSLSKTDKTPAVVPTIGAHRHFQMVVALPEGTTKNLIIKDNLLQAGGVSYVLSRNGSFNVSYTFNDIVSINGQPPAEAVFRGATSGLPLPVDGASGTINWDVGTVVTAEEDDQSLHNKNPQIIIDYYARPNNDIATNSGDTMQNSATVTYDNGETAATETLNDTTPVQTVVEPLLAVSKTVTNLSSGSGSTSVGDVLEFKIILQNTGNSTAFDTNIVETIPALLNFDTGFTPTALINGLAVAGFRPQPSTGSPGALTWGRTHAPVDNSLDIPVGGKLVLTYHAVVKPGIGPDEVISSSALVDWTSLDNTDVSSQYERTGAGCPTITAPDDYCAGPVVAAVSTGAPSALFLQNPSTTNISIGETFSYKITVPAVPQGTALHDVHVLDDLTASAANLHFVSVTKVATTGGSWTPVNTGTGGNLVIADAAGGSGIEIPAGKQIQLLITVTLANTIPPVSLTPLPNESGLKFHNSATYNFNLIDNNDATRSPGSGNATPDMTVVEPDLTLDKRGPAGTVNFTAAIPYTVVVENVGTGPAFDTTIIDHLPKTPDNPSLTGGTCNAAPVNFNARITSAADETTVVRALVKGTDYTVAHSGAPGCELTITTLTGKARIEAGEKLLVSYATKLDVASQSGAKLTNIAGVTQWFSQDTAGSGASGEIRQYTRTITDGTPGTVDAQDAFTVTVEAPVLDVQKSVINVTTGQTPGRDASPGDVLRYSITVKNSGVIDATGITLKDLVPTNASYIANTVTLNGLPVARPDGGVSPLITGIDISSADKTPPLPVAGGGVITAGQTATVSFDVLLKPVITSGTTIQNQATVDSPSTGPLLSDDPGISGSSDPTTTVITSAPAFLVQKTSQDISGDPAVLLPGDTLRYTLTVKNIGQENAINSTLSDQIPANTTYVANSTKLNGVTVSDPTVGVSPLAAGMAINAPENTTAGFLRADTDPAASNVATIRFDVQVNATTVNGTLISNQAMFNADGAGSGSVAQQPSDDPGTPLVNDPTIDVVGNVPVIAAQKTVSIIIDNGTPGVVDPGDTLRYTITASNIGALPATRVRLQDNVPPHTTYVANSVSLNGLPVGQPDAGISPLTAGIAISSADLTPPLPAAGNGILSPGKTATVSFDVQVNAGTVAGTIISNQGFIASNELPVEPTDADGNNANGIQPTDVVVGNVQQLAITKQVFVMGGGAAEAGKQLEYVVRVSNIGGIDALNTVITDDLDAPLAGQKTYVAGSARLNGLAAGVSLSGSVLSAAVGTLKPAAVAELRFRVQLATGLSPGDNVSNTAKVHWNTPPVTLSATASIDIGGTPGSANLSGQVWHDADFSNTPGVNETLLPDYKVELYRNNTLLAQTLTDTRGRFNFTGLPPSLGGSDTYQLRYLAPGATATTATLGNTHSAFTDGPQRISNISAASGANIQNLNLPIQPNGIIYDSVLRVPVAGVHLSMINHTRSNKTVPATCFTDPVQASQVTQAKGYYKFDLNFSDTNRCAPGDEYEIKVQPPAGKFNGTTSVIIPPVQPVTGAAEDVPNCPGSSADKIPATAQYCENSVSQSQPPANIAPRAAGTEYYLKFIFNNVPATDQIYNNHIPVDSKQPSALGISKKAGKLNVKRSELVPYTITFNNTLGVPLFDVSIIDHFPAGFKYVRGSAQVDGKAMEPQVNGQQLRWSGLNVQTGKSRVIKLLLIVGSGVGEGKYVNTAQARNTLTGDVVSGIASATVRVIPDPTFDCTDVIGKVFDDKNYNGYQDKGEKGIAGAQVASVRGLRVTTDTYGRFHITCAMIANQTRGSNLILKLDTHSLPSGYRLTTENPRVERATRGKMLKFDFGAALYRVVKLDLADGVFEKGKTVLRPQWVSRIDLLLKALKPAPSILRLSYLGENESAELAQHRLDAMKALIAQRWAKLDCCYRLDIETELFWRRGKPFDPGELKP